MGSRLPCPVEVVTNGEVSVALFRLTGEPFRYSLATAYDRVLEVLNSVGQDYSPLWGSTLKQAIGRVYPGFNEGNYGYRTFSDLLEDCQAKGLIELEYDEGRGNYKVRQKKE